MLSPQTRQFDVACPVDRPGNVSHAALLGVNGSSALPGKSPAPSHWQGALWRCRFSCALGNGPITTRTVSSERKWFARLLRHPSSPAEKWDLAGLLAVSPGRAASVHRCRGRSRTLVLALSATQAPGPSKVARPRTRRFAGRATQRVRRISGDSTPGRSEVSIGALSGSRFEVRRAYPRRVCSTWRGTATLAPTTRFSLDPARWRVGRLSGSDADQRYIVHRAAMHRPSLRISGTS